MKKTPLLPLIVAGCVSLALSSCDQKSTSTADPAKDRQMQDLQDKIADLNSRSEDLSRQLADRDAADQEAKRSQLERDRADIESEKAQLKQDRETLAQSTPEQVAEAAPNIISQNALKTSSPSSAAADDYDDDEPVYQGKTADYDLFYNKLQHEGSWMETSDYGYIFQPTVAVRDTRWRPYTDGRWVDTDRGWTWDSNEDFGWATYHYGRWINLERRGWCWVPGNEWAPAWVSWRSGDKYVGWAPLPPEARIRRGQRIDARIDVEFGTGPLNYSFVDCEDFGEQTYVGRVVEPSRNVTIINQTVNVTNIVQNNTIIRNYGPDYDKIRSRSRRPVERYQLDLNRNPQIADRGRHARIEGNRLAVSAPVIVNQNGNNTVVRPTKVVNKLTQVQREKGWQGMKPEQRQALRANMEKRADQQAQMDQSQKEKQRRQAAIQARRMAAKETAPKNQQAVDKKSQPPQQAQPEKQDPTAVQQSQQQKEAAAEQARRRQARQNPAARNEKKNEQRGGKDNPTNPVTPVATPAVTLDSSAPQQPHARMKGRGKLESNKTEVKPIVVDQPAQQEIDKPATPTATPPAPSEAPEQKAPRNQKDTQRKQEREKVNNEEKTPAVDEVAINREKDKAEAMEELQAAKVKATEKQEAVQAQAAHEAQASALRQQAAKQQRENQVQEAQQARQVEARKAKQSQQAAESLQRQQAQNRAQQQNRAARAAQEQQAAASQQVQQNEQARRQQAEARDRAEQKNQAVQNAQAAQQQEAVQSNQAAQASQAAEAQQNRQQAIQAQRASQAAAGEQQQEARRQQAAARQQQIQQQQARQPQGQPEQGQPEQGQQQLQRKNQGPKNNPDVVPSEGDSNAEQGN